MTLLPPEIGACTALTWLSLNANKLRVLPPSIGRLTNMVRAGRGEGFGGLSVPRVTHARCLLSGCAGSLHCTVHV